MYKLVAFTTLALTAANAVNGIAIPRATAPSGYDTTILEVSAPSDGYEASH